MRLSHFRLKDDRCVSWPFAKAPGELRELTFDYPGIPDFVTVVPASMRFTHLPPNAAVVVELADGYIAYE